LADALGDPAARPILTVSAYDTAWLASLRSPSAATPRFPRTLDWLVRNQRADGSWGGDVRYEHDRIISTLAALAALGSGGDSSIHQTCLHAGNEYLWRHGERLTSEPVELFGFELLLPALIERAQDVDIVVPPHLDVYKREREAKLRLIPPELLYSSRSTVAHSLEFLGTHVQLAGLQRAQGPNGSIGSSPAATAFYLSLTDDERAEAYLNECLDRSEVGAVPVLYPCETYELLWAAYHLFLAGEPVTALLRATERAALARDLAAGGVSLSPTFPIPDADDTAVALILLDQLGETVSAAVLERFALPDGHFASFPLERHPSVGVNLHVLHALLRVPGYPDQARVVERLVDYIVGAQRDDGYWLDKWHISLYYATAHALRVFAELPTSLTRRVERASWRARQWLWSSASGHGSWGFYGSETTEETALAILGLTASVADPGSIVRRIGGDAVRAIQVASDELHHENDAVAPPLWIDKNLYTSRLVVRSIVESALLALRQYRSTLLRVA
jgi:halimadienyl-diphosphate synthase